MGDRRIPLFYQCFPFRVRFACVRYVCVCMRVCVRLCHSSSILVLVFCLFVLFFFLSFFSLQYKRGTVSIGAEKNLYLLSYSFRTGSHSHVTAVNGKRPFWFSK